MQEKKQVSVMMLGDHSICIEHFIRPYYNLKSGSDTRFVLDICESNGIEIEVNKKKVNLNIRIATTRSGTSRQATDKIRSNDYERRMINIDAIILYFYQNNSKTLYNIENKYLDEIKSIFPRVPYFLLSLRLNENVDGLTKPLRETISIQDRWLKRDLDVTREEGLKLMKKINAKNFFEVKTLRQVEVENVGGICYDYNLNECDNIDEPFQEILKYILRKRQKLSWRKYLCCCCCCCCKTKKKQRRFKNKKEERLIDD